MTKPKSPDDSERVARCIEAPTEDAEAAIAAGGDVVGRSVDDELLVEGPNSK